MSAPGRAGGAAAFSPPRRYASVVANIAVAARFLPVWLATGVLMIVAAIIVPAALQHTNWAFVLPYMTILAIASLGQMLVIMQAGIDLSTPAVISFGGNLLVGVSVGHNGRLALGILACIGLGAGVGLVNGILVGIVRLNPLIVTLAVGQIVFAWNLRYAREVTNSTAVPEALSSWAGEKWLGVSVRLLDRRRADRWPSRSCFATPPPAGASRRSARTREPRGWPACASGRTSSSRTRRQGSSTDVAAVLLAGIRINVDPQLGAAYLLAPIAAVVIAGASLSGGLASATSTWVAALALTFLTQMLLIKGLRPGMQFIVFGAAIIVGMLISGDRIASLLGRVLRPVEGSSANNSGVELNTS